MALKQLKNNKSRDPSGIANEILKPNVIGSDLKLAILKLMNIIKKRSEFPECLQECNITTIRKGNKNRTLFDSYWGIFRVSIFREILDRLIFNSTHYELDEKLSDQSTGARSLRGARDNILTISASTNSVINGGHSPVHIQLYDIVKCFDKKDWEW